ARILPAPPLGPLTSLAPLASVAPAALPSAVVEISSGWDDGRAAWELDATAAPTEPAGIRPKRSELREPPRAGPAPARSPEPAKRDAAPAKGPEPAKPARPGTLADDLTLDPAPSGPNMPASRRDPFFTPSKKPPGEG
ncbi:hypothetical protein L6R52_44190, partial [Myxococcota bacterium]|nr:hypothetical protein [Myxococcota bacterium]